MTLHNEVFENEIDRKPARPKGDTYVLRAVPSLRTGVILGFYHRCTTRTTVCSRAIVPKHSKVGFNVVRGF